MIAGTRLRSAALAAALVWAGAVQAQTMTLSLRSSLEEALQRQPELAGAKAQAGAARERLRQADAAYLPTLSAAYSTSQTWSSGRLSPGASTSLTSRNGDLTASWQVLDGGARSASRSSAKAGLDSAALAQEQSRQTVIHQVASSYYSAQKARELVKVSEANVRMAQVTLDLVQAQIQEEAAARKDAYQAQADLAAAQVSLLDAQNADKVALASLRQAIGLPFDQDVALEPFDLGQDPSTAPAALAELQAQASSGRPDLLQAVKSVDAEKAGVRLARATKLWSLSLDTSLTSLFAPNSEQSRMVGLTVSVPLFDGGTGQAAVREAEQSLKSAEASLASKKLAAALEVEQAYRTLEKARLQVPAAAASQTAAQASYDAILASRREGIGTILDVATAQAALVKAQTSRIQAVFDLHTADADLKSAIGRAEAILEEAGR